MSNLFINKTAVKDSMSIPGIHNSYYVKNDGTVWKRAENGEKDIFIKGYSRGKTREYYLIDENGQRKRIQIGAIMKNTYFKGKIPDGYKLFHINGMKDDWSVWNLRPISPQECGRLTYRWNNARSVFKRDVKTWEVVDIFTSAAKASKKAGCSADAILDACNKKNVHNPGIAPDGYYYQWED